MTRLRGLKDLEVATKVQGDVEKEMIQSGYLEGAPFDFVSLMIRYGLKYDTEPEIQKISKRYCDLPLAIEVDVRDMLGANHDQLYRMFRKATLIALIAGGQEYSLKIDRLVELLREIE